MSNTAKFTVGELKAILKDYPNDSRVLLYDQEGVKVLFDTPAFRWNKANNAVYVGVLTGNEKDYL